MKHTLRMYFALSLVWLFSCSPDDNVVESPQGQVTTFVDSTAGLYDPSAICTDPSGTLFILDQNKIFKASPAGEVSVFAGSGAGYVDGTGTAAKFNQPWGITSDAAGNLYVADMGNHRIRKVTPAGVVTTLAGGLPGYAEGTGNTAKFWFPVGVTVDLSGNVIVADQINCRIRKITPAGVVTTFSGNSCGNTEGTATQSKFGAPTGVCVDNQGFVYVADYENDRIRKLTVDGSSSTLAGKTRGYKDSVGIYAKFDRPFSICVDAQSDVFVCDLWNARLRKVSSDGNVVTLGNTTRAYIDGNFPHASFLLPRAVCSSPSGDIYVLEGRWVRKMTLP